MRYPLLVLIAASLAFAPGASAAPVAVKPTYAVTAAAKSGKKVKFVLTVTLPPGIPSCPKKERVTASTKLSRKKTAKWSARYTGDSAICTAAIHGKLSVAKYGKTVKFKIKFPGSKSIKKFSASKKLKLVPPPPPADDPGGIPATHGPQSPGQWYMFKAGDSSDIGMSFKINADYKVPAITRPSGLPMNCTPSGIVSVPFNWENTFFGMGTQVGTVSSSGNSPYVTGMTYELTWNFANAHEGTGHFSATGTFNNSGSIEPCSTSYDVTLSGGN